MKNIMKHFPGVKALDGVDFEMNSGEIHALVGANGAGKSTLMKILAGAYQATKGSIYLDEKEVIINNPIDAKQKGIVIVYQEVDTALVSYLTVAENIMMDYIIAEQNQIKMNWKEIRCRAQKQLDELNIDINVNTLVSELSLSQKQMVLIARAVLQDAKFLLLDEPTAPLSVEETEKLFIIVRKLKKEGISIVFISHRLDEVFKICESITVLRDGKLVGTYCTKDITIDYVVEKMLGKKLENTFPKNKVTIGETLFETIGIGGSGGISNVSIKVKKGEIVGISGLVGGGKTELCKLLYGEGTIETGQVFLKNKELHIKSPAQAVKEGLALVPEERRKEGILVNEAIDTNITLTTLEKHCKGVFMDKRKIKVAAEECIEKVGVKTPSEKQIVANLSGGNQQKVAIGKWLLSDAEVFILDEPTKGVDVGSKAEIYKLIGELVKQGKGVIYATCEFSEILGLTDRTYVMYKGKVVKELITKETSEEELLLNSAGGGRNE